MGQSMHLLDAVIQVNRAQPRQIISLLKKHFQSLAGVRISILGLAFKPGTDDMRESPAIPVIQTLLDSGAQLCAFDPIAKDEAVKLFGQTAIEYATSLEDALSQPQAVVVLTRWDEFNQLPELIGTLDPQPLVIDGRRMLDKKNFTLYEGIGL
jgi:UDPglucose 6-dehydrogenase/GDP-mannose 6-dehydrogenase